MGYDAGWLLYVLADAAIELMGLTDGWHGTWWGEVFFYRDLKIDLDFEISL